LRKQGGNEASLGQLFPQPGGKDRVYRIWGTAGEGGLHRKRRCETNEFLEIAPLELLPAGTGKALNASVPAEGHGEEDKGPHGLKGSPNAKDRVWEERPAPAKGVS
jgi:hypothetical protein